MSGLGIISGSGSFRGLYRTPIKSAPWLNQLQYQRAKKVVSDSLGLVDFAIELVNFELNLPDGQVKFFEEFK